MSKLKAAAPQLAFDQDELKKWGLAWRVGTMQKAKKAKERKKRKKGKGVEDESEGPDGAQEAVGDADDEASAQPKVKVAPLTKAAAGVPAELNDFVTESKYPSAFNKKQGMDFGVTFDRAVGRAIADMLGDIPVVDFVALNAGKKAKVSTRAAVKALVASLAAPAKKAVAKTAAVAEPPPPDEIAWTAWELLPPHPNCVEVGPARVIGGIRPQNFDVAYRPDGPRIVYDSKSLNDAESIPKNWQNMVNDLGTEATTVHTRFPYAIVAFIVAVPKPAIRGNQMSDMIRTLERLATRRDVDHPNHLAEAIALVVWDPESGAVDTSMLDANSSLRIQSFMDTIFSRYVERYKGLPPHEKN